VAGLTAGSGISDEHCSSGYSECSEYSEEDDTESRSSLSRDGWTGRNSDGCSIKEPGVSSVHSGVVAREVVNCERWTKGLAEASGQDSATRARDLPSRAEHEIMRIRYSSLKEQVARCEEDESRRLWRGRIKMKQCPRVGEGDLPPLTGEAEVERLRVPKRRRLSEGVWFTTLAEVSIDLPDQSVEVEFGATEAECDGLFGAYSRELSP